jgi:hypothetical protein
MSYSFSIRAASKADALTKVQEQFKEVVRQQPVHVQDFEGALDAVDAYLGMLMTDDTRDVAVSVHGSVSYQWEAGVNEAQVALSSVSLGISAYLVAKEPVADPIDPGQAE